MALQVGKADRNSQKTKHNKLVAYLITASVMGGAMVLTSPLQAAVPKSPWQANSRIKASQTSPVYKQEWRKSNYKACPILALPTTASSQLTTAKARAANFSGGFAVAYDMASYQGKPLRSAYGVANAGKTTLTDMHSWDYERFYEDGSYITLGHEGNHPQGKMLAYLVLKNGCFYNVWSQLGESHLQQMISQLRYVK